MLSLKSRLLSGTFLPVVVGMGVALAAGGPFGVLAQSGNPCAAAKPVAGNAAANPCAAGAAGPCNPCAAAAATGERTYTIREGDSLASLAGRVYGNPSLYPLLAAYNGIADPDLIEVGQIIRLPANLAEPGAGPGGAQKVAANPCNPCAAAASPCNPCAAQKTVAMADCVVPRLQAAAAQNPCAASKAANPCNPCNPCAAQAAVNPCNPCAATNPCAAAANPCNPCNPCAPAEAVELTEAEASAAYACIKGAMQAAYAGQLRQAAASPCNPCAAANPCNPCAVIKPANPCAANPSNPCAAKSPCKPEAAATHCAPQIIQAAARATPAAAVPGEVANVVRSYQGWRRLNTVPYVSATHGSRYVNNYPGPEAAAAYAKFEDIGTMPAGGRIAKDSFTVTPDGRVAVGPLFVMEKMDQGFDPATHDWRYAMIMPDGSLFGVTGGQGSQNVQFCAECHAIVAAEQDSLYFIPEEYRVSSR
jgi:hypothetical protein